MAAKTAIGGVAASDDDQAKRLQPREWRCGELMTRRERSLGRGEGARDLMQDGWRRRPRWAVLPRATTTKRSAFNRQARGEMGSDAAGATARPERVGA